MNPFRTIPKTQAIRPQNPYVSNLTAGVCLQNTYDYSPFGVSLDGRTMESEFYRYGFNGKVKDDEVDGEGNIYDYGYRIYNCRIGKFLSRDPLAKSYPFYTPYQFAGNTPIMAIDLDGREVKITIGDVPNGTTELRVIGNNDNNLAPKSITVFTYPLTVTDEATGTTSTYSVTRDALFVNNTERPDAQNNVTIFNIPFEPAEGKSHIYEGEERKTFMSTELPAIRLRQNGSTTLPAEPNDSPWREAGENYATNINIHVGGEYTTSTTKEGYVNVTGSEGCFTVLGGNEGIKTLQEDIDYRQRELSSKKLPTNIIIDVTPREDVPKSFEVPARN